MAVTTMVIAGTRRASRSASDALFWNINRCIAVALSEGEDRRRKVATRVRSCRWNLQHLQRIVQLWRRVRLWFGSSSPVTGSWLRSPVSTSTRQQTVTAAGGATAEPYLYTTAHSVAFGFAPVVNGINRGCALRLRHLCKQRIKSQRQALPPLPESSWRTRKASRSASLGFVLMLCRNRPVVALSESQ